MAPGMMVVKSNQNVSGWHLQSGYTNPHHKKNYPFQGIDLNALNRISIWHQTFSNDFEHQCRGIDQGFKIVLSMPGEALLMSQNYFRISLTHLNQVKIIPELITTTESLRHFKPYQRKCFYDDERKLRFFKMYTKINCEVECQANFTKTMCECVKFSMPSTQFKIELNLKNFLY